MNVDGAGTQDHVVACGGVLRDEQCKFIEGFMFKVDKPTDSLLSELWAVLFGLKMCWDSGERQVVLETDAAEVVSLIQGPTPTSHPDLTEITEIKSMLL